MSTIAEHILSIAADFPEATARQIAIRAGCSPTYIYQLVKRDWTRLSTSGTVRSHIRIRNGKACTVSIIPVRALRAAGLDTAKQLKFTAANGKITFEAL